MVLVQKTVKNIYLGAPPVDEWILYDETDAANSTSWSSGTIASTNGHIIRPSYTFWGGNWNYTIGTYDWYPCFVCNQCHWNIHLWMNDTYYNERTSHSKIKVVVDYMYVCPASSYGDSSGGLNWTSSTSWWRMEFNNWGRQTTWLWSTYESCTPYSCEYIIDTSNFSTDFTLTKLSDSSTITWNFTWQLWKETSSSYILNWWWYAIGMAVADYCSGASNRVRIWNIHLYYLNQ